MYQYTVHTGVPVNCLYCCSGIPLKLVYLYTAFIPARCTGIPFNWYTGIPFILVYRYIVHTRVYMYTVHTNLLIYRLLQFTVKDETVWKQSETFFYTVGNPGPGGSCQICRFQLYDNDFL